MMKDKREIIDLIRKYALLLSALYFLETVLSVVISRLGREMFTESIYVLAFVPTAFTFAANLIAALMVAKDSGTEGRSALVIAATLLFRPVGVVAFLLLAMMQLSREEGDGFDVERETLD